jgi:hypothetical protein
MEKIALTGLLLFGCAGTRHYAVLPTSELSHLDGFHHPPQAPHRVTDTEGAVHEYDASKELLLQCRMNGRAIHGGRFERIAVSEDRFTGKLIAGRELQIRLTYIELAKLSADPRTLDSRQKTSAKGSGHGMRALGATLTVVGGLFVTGGLIALATSRECTQCWWRNPQGEIGMLSAIVGAPLLVGGIPLWIAGQSRIDRAEQASTRSAIFLRPALVSDGATVASGVHVAGRF